MSLAILSAQGTAFLALQSCANHSCEPCAAVAWRGDGRVQLTALRDIDAGDEVTISYIDERQPLEARRKELQDYGFVCRCTRCLRCAACVRLRCPRAQVCFVDLQAPQQVTRLHAVETRSMHLRRDRQVHGTAGAMLSSRLSACSAACVL